MERNLNFLSSIKKEATEKPIRDDIELEKGAILSEEYLIKN